MFLSSNTAKIMNLAECLQFKKKKFVVSVNKTVLLRSTLHCGMLYLTATTNHNDVVYEATHYTNFPTNNYLQHATTIIEI